MPGRLLHLREPRLGIGLPAKTVRPWRRRGDALLEGFLAALADPAERVVLTGRLFARPNPPAHLVDRVVAPLGRLVGAGAEVIVPPGTPRPLLFLAAGVRLEARELSASAPEFWRTGSYRVDEDGRSEIRRVPMPGAADVPVDVTGRGAAEALAEIRERLHAARRARFVRLVLVGRTDEPELLALGPRELTALLPGGLVGAVVKDLDAGPGPRPVPEDEAERRVELARVRASLPEAPVATGVYEFLDDRGRVLYVGKAVDLRRRIASHFTAEAREASPRGPMLLATRTVRVTETADELTALLTEARRIREVRPPYNRQMKERESYRYLRADVAGPMPRLASAPEVAEAEGATWYGPFPKRWLVERALRVLQVIYGVPSCDWAPGEAPPAVCTDRELRICAAPCVGRVTIEEHRRRVRMALEHLSGEGSGAAPFGALNPPSAGLLGGEDLGILDGFVRSFRRLVANLRGTSGGIPLPDGRTLLVLGGLRAGFLDDPRKVERRVAEFARGPGRTWVTPAEADEVRILSHWLRRVAGGPERSRAAGSLLVSGRGW